MTKSYAFLLVPALGLALTACGDDDTTVGGGTGDLTVLLEAEDTITDGLDAGDEGESIQDGWQVRYEKFIITIGAIDVHFATDESIGVHADDVFVVDLKDVQENGLPLWDLEGLRAGRWQFGYSILGGSDGASRHSSVSEADFETVQDGDLTYLIEGSLTKADGVSCPPASKAAPPDSATADGENSGGDPCYANPEISFTIATNDTTVFGPCEIDGVPGVSIAAGSTQTVAATIHGDHLFFNGFPEGDEGGVTRLAQWLADSDLDLDGAVTEEELESIIPADLPELDDRYQLGGSPLELDNMWTYVQSQLKTQGHMDGEGECPFDGFGHED